MGTQGTADQKDTDNARSRIRTSCPALATSRPTELPLLLSVRLRQQTALLHRQTEELLGLPGAIRTRHDYAIWLGRFLGLYEPVEQVLAGFPEWDTSRIARPSLSNSESITDDLAALGVDPIGVARSPPTLLPSLPTFAHALGALYVLEGATLGGRVILRDINARIGDQIAGATQFFGGRGDEVGTLWLRFRTRLDAFGNEHPPLHADVVTGAERVFRAMLAWFAPFRAVTAAPQ